MGWFGRLCEMLVFCFGVKGFLPALTYLQAMMNDLNADNVLALEKDVTGPKASPSFGSGAVPNSTQDSQKIRSGLHNPRIVCEVS